MKRNGRHVVAVVLGGTSAGARDARMRAAAGAARRQRLHPQDRADDRRSAGARYAARRRRADRGAPETGGANRFEMASAAAPRGRAARLRSRRRLRRADPPGRGPHRFGEAARRQGRQGRTVPGPRRPSPPRHPGSRSRSRRLPPPPAPKHRTDQSAPPRAAARAGFLGVLPAPARTASVSETPPAPPPPRRSARAEPVREAAPQREAAVQPAAPPAPARAVIAAAEPAPAGSSRSAPIRPNRKPSSAWRLAKTKASRLLAAGEPLHRDGAAGRNHPLSGPFCRASSANRRRRPANSSSATTSIASQ